MKIVNKYTTLLLSLCAAFTACSDNEVLPENTPTTGGEEVAKTPIELKVGEEDTDAPTTRAAIIDGKGKVTAFEKHTRLTLLMVSEDKAETSPKYAVTYGLAIGNGLPATDPANVDTKSKISFATTKTADTQQYTNPANQQEDSKTIADGDGSMRYWDDAHARTSQLSIYGFCVNGTILPSGAPWKQMINSIVNTEGTNFQNVPNASDPDYGLDFKIGGESNGARVKWKVGQQSGSANYTYQSFLSLLYKDDICYSNNIANYNTDGTDETKDKRMKFDNQETKKFDSGVLEFHRAMSMISFKIEPGAGFDENSSSNFNFVNGNIALKGFYKEGLLDIKKGAWDPTSLAKGVDATYAGVTGYSWNSIANVTEGKTINVADDHTYYLLSLMIPGTDLNDESVTDAVTFNIDGNVYKLSMKALYDAIIANRTNWNSALSLTESDIFDKNSSGNYSCLKAGINYEFTFRVGKTAIDKIQAKVVDWVTVAATATPDNAHPLTINMETLAGTETPVESYLYKSATNAEGLTDVEKGYSNSDRFQLAGNTNVQNTGWYWPSNSTYYHFRTISPQLDLTQDGTTNDNYLTMVSGAVNTEKDYVWGAPLKEEHTAPVTNHVINYDAENGYKDYLYPAIGPTKDNIHITQLHMMSDLEINLQTTTDAATVTLAGATVSLVNYASTANLMIGTGLVVPNSSSITTTDAITKITDVTKYTWRNVPQPLSRGDAAADKVGLKITLTDGNIYEIKDLSNLTVAITGSTDTKIQSWEPGKKYVYTLTLKKSAIDNIKATVVDWETVEATYDNVVIQ